MKETTYTLPVGDQTLTYGYSVQLRKWAFKTARDCYLIRCRGAEMGHKVASIIAGALKRSGKMDGMARANISKITA